MQPVAPSKSSVAKHDITADDTEAAADVETTLSHKHQREAKLCAARKRKTYLIIKCAASRNNTKPENQ